MRQIIYNISYLIFVFFFVSSKVNNCSFTLLFYFSICLELFYFNCSNIYTNIAILFSHIPKYQIISQILFFSMITLLHDQIIALVLTPLNSYIRRQSTFSNLPHPYSSCGVPFYYILSSACSQFLPETSLSVNSDKRYIGEKYLYFLFLSFLVLYIPSIPSFFILLFLTLKTLITLKS